MIAARRIAALAGAGLAAVALGGAVFPAAAEQLYTGGNWPALTADQRADAVGDIVTVLISQQARASSRLVNNSSRNTEVGGSIGAFGLDESASLEFGGSYAGRGETTRSEEFVAQISAQVVAIEPNGDLVIEGQQDLLVNGEETRVELRGIIRPNDIRDGNYVLSSRIAQAQINYDGQGFVSRSARPGLLNRIFSFLGIG